MQNLVNIFFCVMFCTVRERVLLSQSLHIPLSYSKN